MNDFFVGGLNFENCKIFSKKVMGESKIFKFYKGKIEEKRLSKIQKIPFAAAGGALRHAAQETVCSGLRLG
jgi:hypothetical protein